MAISLALTDKKTKKIELNEAIFDRPYNEALVHQIVVAYLAGGRAGTQAQKSRSEVRGGGAKPWRQKGTGRARAGTINSPLWRSGGVTFAAKPRSYKQKLNKKMYSAGIKTILSELRRQDRLFIVDDLALKEPKTKLFLEAINAKKIEFNPKKQYERLLLVTDAWDETLTMAARNVPNVAFMTSQQIDPVTLVAAHKVVLTVAAIKQIEELLG